MEPKSRKPSGREKDEASLKLLERLCGQLYSSNPSTRRQVAFNLSWMQEDGLEILQQALFADSPARIKNAAAYGLRKMRGRMKNMSLDVLQQGLRHAYSSTREVCRNALALLGKKPQEEPLSRKPTPQRLRIKEIPRRVRPKRRIDMQPVQKRRRPRNQSSS